MEALKAGDVAPNFALKEDGSDAEKDLASLRGQPVVLYFYPKDDTPGCTTEARDFSCLMPEFEKAGVQVVGVSPDSIKSHGKFRAKHELTGGSPPTRTPRSPTPTASGWKSRCTGARTWGWSGPRS